MAVIQEPSSIEIKLALGYLRRGQHIHGLTDEVVEQISLRLGEELVRRGHPSSLVFFDCTNFSTEQQTLEGNSERQLAKSGHAKDGNLQAKLVGLATAVTGEHLPVYHRTHPGNENDAKLFQEVVGTMVAQLEKFGVVADDLTFVFDKGVNSEDGRRRSTPPRSTSLPR